MTLAELRALTNTLAKWLAATTSLIFAFSRFLPSGRPGGYDIVEDAWTQMLHMAFAERLQFGRDIQLQFGVINRTATAHEAAPKNTVVPLNEFLPVPHNVTAIVRFVSHHNHDGIARHMGESVGDRAPESLRPRIFHGPQGGNETLG